MPQEHFFYITISVPLFQKNLYYDCFLLKNAHAKQLAYLFLQGIFGKILLIKSYDNVISGGRCKHYGEKEYSDGR